MNNTVSADIIKRIDDKILEVLTILQARYPHVILEIPTYTLKQLGRRGGIAYILQNRMEFNSDFFKNHCEDMINQTVPHEVAHLVSVKVYGVQLGGGHGRFWKGVMYGLNSIGVKVTRCHEYSLEGVKVRRVTKPYAYECGCMKHEISINLHTKMQSGRKYSCRKCRRPLKLLGFNFVPKAA